MPYSLPLPRPATEPPLREGGLQDAGHHRCARPHRGCTASRSPAAQRWHADHGSSPGMPRGPVQQTMAVRPTPGPGDRATSQRSSVLRCPSHHEPWCCRGGSRAGLAPMCRCASGCSGYGRRAGSPLRCRGAAARRTTSAVDLALARCRGPVTGPSDARVSPAAPRPPTARRDLRLISPSHRQVV
jgi:hypothetical protein